MCDKVRYSHLSVVIPVYKAKECLSELYRRLVQTLEQITPDFELVLVEDNGGDGSWEQIAAFAEGDPRVKGIKLSRNFGQHYAIMAGLTYVTGEWVVVMDCDLQDAPEEIPGLYKKACEGYSVVFAQRVNREDSWFKRAQSSLFHAVFDYLTDRKSDPTVANFGIYHRKVIKAVLNFGDCVKCFPLIVSFVGFKTTFLPVTHMAREMGKSSYTFGKVLRYAVGLMLAYSNKPLRLFTTGGFVIFFLSLLVGFYFLILHLAGRIAVSGFTSLIVSVWLLGGLLMMQIGVIGVYLGRVFNQTKNRPSFVVDETVNTTAGSPP